MIVYLEKINSQITTEMCYAILEDFRAEAWAHVVPKNCLETHPEILALRTIIGNQK